MASAETRLPSLPPIRRQQTEVSESLFDCRPLLRRTQGVGRSGDGVVYGDAAFSLAGGDPADLNLETVLTTKHAAHRRFSHDHLETSRSAERLLDGWTLLRGNG